MISYLHGVYLYTAQGLNSGGFVPLLGGESRSSYLRLPASLDIYLKRPLNESSRSALLDGLKLVKSKWLEWLG